MATWVISLTSGLFFLAISEYLFQLSDGATNNGEENTCTLYIAESSVQGINGVGIFTAKSFNKGDVITPPDAPSIPVCDPWSLSSGTINHYWWGEGKGTLDDMSFESTDYCMDFFVQFGSLPNYHTLLKNIMIDADPIPYDDSFIESTANPGAGAFTCHGGRTILAKSYVSAGDELFLDYGLDYDVENDFKGHWFEHVPRSYDFESAGSIIEDNWEKLQDIRAQIQYPEEVEHALNQEFSKLREAGVLENERIAAIMPKTKTQLDRIAERSGGRMPMLAKALAQEVSLTRRSPEWLKENARCVDNIVPGPSTLPFAGRGAFAQRFIARGEVVVPVPLIQIMDRDALIKWEEVQNENGDWDEVPYGQQLLLNYCFGHDESSLLLLPITNAILVNHCSNRTKECGKDGPNAEWHWDTEWDRDTKRWLNMTLQEMAEQEGRGLSFEIVATRDIQPGEEVFIEYGLKWQEAWNEHVDLWTPDEDEPLDSVKRWNDEGGPIKILSGDLRVVADHDRITTGCIYWDEFDEDDEGYYELYGEAEGWGDDYYPVFPGTDILWRYSEDGQRVYRPLVFEDDTGDLELSPSEDLWQELNDEGILWYFGEDGSQFTAENSPRRISLGSHWPCSVVRQETEDTYTVQVFPKPKSREPQPAWVEEGLPRFLTNYPRDSVRYFTKPDHSDMHLESAFRHSIDIPDDMFPPQWRNRPKEGNEDRDEL